jgi:hypothetical protein
MFRFQFHPGNEILSRRRQWRANIAWGGFMSIFGKGFAAVFLILPSVALAQETVTCGDFSAMAMADQVVALKAAAEASLARGSGSGLPEGATDEDLVNYVLSQCDDPESDAALENTVPLIDVIGE